MITFRPLTEADAPAYDTLSREGIAAFPDAFLLTAAEAEATPLDRTAARIKGWMHGAFDGGRLVGFAGLSDTPWAQTKHRAHIGPVYVDPAQQGTGVARDLMAYIADLAQSRGVNQLELWVAEHNLRARAFYTDCGFRKTGTIPSAVRRNGEICDDIFMARSVADPLPARGGDGLRRLGPGDWRAFREVRLAMLAANPRDFGSTHAEWSARAPDEVAEWLRMIRLFAVVEQGEVQATLGWHQLSGAVQAHRGHIIAVFTRPGARRRGHFQRLFDAALADARAQGIAQLELDVRADNDAARAAYEANGFTATGGIPRALKHDGQIANQLYMVRPV